MTAQTQIVDLDTANASTVARETMTAKELSAKIYQQICAIPAHNPMVISFGSKTLSSVVDRELLKKIADVAAATALSD